MIVLGEVQIMRPLWNRMESAKLVRDCRAVAKALTYKQEDVLDIEKVQRNKLKKNQVKW